ncbi:MAG: polysaccharide deacetylase family protein [Erysipelotrichaceae bacterium]|nr:polysaccharide deacetylase family protein [Erysipelotrichaceae bacterium]
MYKNIKWFYPNFKNKAVTFSFDDGVYQDIEMINMLDYFHLKATFNVNSALMNNNGTFTMNNWLKNYKIEKRRINEIYKNHEIAGHTSTHCDFKNYDEQYLINEVDEDIKNLSKLTRRKIVGFAYPYGIYNDDVIKHLKKCGVIYARSVESTFNFNLPQDWFTYGGTCTISDKAFPSLINRWLRLNPKSPKLFYIWGHSYELDMFHEHEKVWKLYEKIANKDDTYYATNAEIVTYINAISSLKFDKNTKKLSNMSNVDLFLLVNDKKTILKAKKAIFVK